jgi:hypothetical protein
VNRLLDHELVFVTGKGGAGTTTVAAALGRAAARTGRRVVVCELAGSARVPDLVAGSDVATTTIDPYRVLEEWLAGAVGSQRLSGLVTRTPFFRAFADAAPGGNELGAAVKAWMLAQEHDLVIVDGPAIGHAEALVRVPATYARIARVGPLASQCRHVRDWLADPERTAYVGVARPEELAVNEVLGSELPFAAVVANGVLPDRFSDAELEEVGEVEALRSAAARSRSQQAELARLEAAVDVPVLRLPQQIVGLDLDALADHLPVA